MPACACDYGLWPQRLKAVPLRLFDDRKTDSMKLKTLFGCSVLSIFTSCNGQTTDSRKTSLFLKEVNVTGDTVKELGSSVMVIYQDKKNTYWFGSWESGVYKYDGKTLINYTTKHGLYHQRVDDIKEDKLGNIYFSGMNPNSTITKFDGKSFTNIVATPSKEWKLGANDVWLVNFYQSKQKVYRFDGIKLYELTLPNPPHLNNPFDVYSIYKDSKGNIWFGTNPVGVCRYNGKSFEWITEEDVTEFRNEGANGVRSIAEDKNGDFWFNTEKRYTIYDSTTLKGEKFYTRHEGIGSLDGKNTRGLKEFLSTVRDKENNLWFVTYPDGVWKYDGTKITHYQIQAKTIGVTLFSIYKDNNGDLWLGTPGNGAYRFNGKSFERFKP